MPVSCGSCGEIILSEEGNEHPSDRMPCQKCGSTARSIERYMVDRIGISDCATAVVIPYPRILLQAAQRFTDGGDYGVAVIVAHMACEVAAERALGAAFASRGISDLEEPVEAFMNGYSLANPRNRDLYNALCGASLQTQPFWSQFCASATLRNKIIHRGEIMSDKAQAEASLKACKDLLTYLKL
jgi:hypothetical protein